MYALGLDIGTTNIKCIALSPQGALLHTASRPNRLQKDDFNAWVFSPDTLWDTACQCMKECVAACGKNPTITLAISSMVEAGVALDSSGTPLAPIIPWNDRRTLPYLEEITRHFSIQELYSITGQVLHTKYPLSRLLWYKEHLPAVFSSMTQWLSVGDYLLLRLTGQSMTDYTQASRTMVFDITEGRWHQGLMDFLEVPSIFPKVQPMGTLVGNLRPTVAKVLGVSSRSSVHLGAHDHLCASLPLSLTPEVFMDSIGTSEVLVGLLDRPILTEKALAAGINQGRLHQDSYYWMTSLPSAGRSIEWLRSLLSVHKPIPYSALLDGTKESRTHSVQYLPYLNGQGSPKIAPESRGAFLGLSSNHSRQDLLKAIYEGTSFQSRWILHSLKEALGLFPHNLYAVGGGARNKEWLKTKAEVLRTPVITFQNQELAAQGAAGLGSGRWTPLLLADHLSPTGLRDLYYEEKYQQFLRYNEQLT